jgi:hypothetical protein
MCAAANDCYICVRLALKFAEDCLVCNDLLLLRCKTYLLSIHIYIASMMGLIVWFLCILSAEMHESWTFFFAFLHLDLQGLQLLYVELYLT